MKSLKRLTALTAAVSLAMLLGGSAVPSVYAEKGYEDGQKQSMEKEHFRHARHERHGMHDRWNMFKGLNLSAAQKEQVKGIMKGHRSEFTEGKIAMLKARQNLITVTTAPAFDQAAVQKAFGDVSAAQEKMAILRAKIFSEVMPILTPEQQTVVSGRIAQSKLRMEKMIARIESKKNRMKDQ